MVSVFLETLIDMEKDQIILKKLLVGFRAILNINIFLKSRICQIWPSFLDMESRKSYEKGISSSNKITSLDKILMSESVGVHHAHYCIQFSLPFIVLCNVALLGIPLDALPLWD